MNNNSGVNTILIVVLLVVVVGVVVWFMRGGMAEAPNDTNGEIDVNVEMPNFDNGEGDNA